MRSGGTLGATRERFWSIAPDADSGEDSYRDSGHEDAEGSPAVSPDEYLAACKTPEKEDCDLSAKTSSAVLRRERKKIRLQEAAILLHSGTRSSPGCSLSSGSKFSSSSAAVQSRKVRFRSPILSPTTFLLDSFDAAEWVVVQRRRRQRQWGRRRGVWPPARSHPKSTQRPLAGVSKFPNLGHLGLIDNRFNANYIPYGRMGQELLRRKVTTDRIPQFASGVRFRLGFNRSSAPLVP